MSVKMKKVLVIEDNETNLFLMRTILEKIGHHVIEARNGYDGVELAISQQPDLILMDIQLPGMDGIMATKKIRENETTEDIPIIAITSYAMVGDRERILTAGCTSYMEKPIDPESFIDEINKYL